MSKLASLSVFLISLLIHTSLSPERGSDLWFYYSFEEKGIPPSVFLRLDNLFYLLLEISNDFVEVRTYITVISSVAFLLFFRAVYDLGKGKIPIVFIFLLVPLISYLSGIRSFIATALILNAWSILQRDRKVSFLLTSVFALWFHVSILPAIGAILILERKYNLLIAGMVISLIVYAFVDWSFYISKIKAYAMVKNDIAMEAISTNNGRFSYFLQYMWFLPIMILMRPRGRAATLLILLLNVFSFDALFRTSYFVKPMSLSLIGSRVFLVKILILVSFLIQIITLRDLF